MDDLSFGVLAALAGMIGGLALGLAARLGDFCTLGALEAALYSDDQRRLRLWGIVLGTAILGTFTLAQVGAIDVSATFYHSIEWNPLASILGGLVFGYGMALAGNCGFGALVRLGGGDLRSLVVVIVIAVFSFVALSGPLAPLRNMVFPQIAASGPQGFAQYLGALAGVQPLAIALAVALGCIAWALNCAGLRRAPRQIAWGVLAGSAVVWSFAATSWLANESLGQIPVEGVSFTAPIGRTLMYFMTSTAGGITFSVGSVAGVLLGALAGSVFRGRFRWEACEDPRELGRQISGAALMGIGGVVALGCSVGQGVSAFATLAYSGPVTLIAIAAGAAFGLRQLIQGFEAS